MTARTLGPGMLIAIVGPSGSGKDTLLRGARSAFTGRADVVFPRRTITRLDPDDSEDHLPMTPDAFEAALRAGRFALSWQAHGLSYGIDIAIDAEIAAGRTVVVNLSRRVLGLAAARYANTVVAVVRVEPQVLRERLIARGRETGEEIERRLRRDKTDVPGGLRVVEIENSGSIADAQRRFCTLIETAAPDLSPLSLSRVSPG